MRYVWFAERHPAHFRVMYQPELWRRDDPELAAARDRTAELLRAGLPDDLDADEAVRTGLGAWSIAHGFATLWLSGNLERAVGDRDPAEAFRDLAGLLHPGRHVA
ncbi:TetR-like C-terminal domain-containing protein [Streptomyces sp. NPDC048639]|uniref:TetR-like C-terminal domain-containing protein n=1 Tax=Streptomyces sp. NPDC048639 TaxID=3365581 RepID=UPI00371219CC